MENVNEKINYIDDNYYLNSLTKKIKLFIEKVENGETDYCEELAIKIRICLIPKSGKRPYLENVMKRYSINILVNKPEPMNPVALQKGSFAICSNSEIWFQDLPRKNLHPILDVFNSSDPSIKFGNHTFTYKEIIENLGDKFGGGHIDENIDQRKLLVFSNSIIIYGKNINDSVTLATSRALLIALEKILKFIETGMTDDFLINIH